MPEIGISPMMCELRIRRVANGFKVTATDPEIIKKNRKDDEGYSDPDVDLVFSTVEEIKDFLDEHIETALPPMSYETSFSKAIKEIGND